MRDATSSTIAVVIPVYQSEQTVAACLASVLGQTFRDFEVVVVDDGSTDRSADIVADVADPGYACKPAASLRGTSAMAPVDAAQPQEDTSGASYPSEGHRHHAQGGLDRPGSVKLRGDKDNKRPESRLCRPLFHGLE